MQRKADTSRTGATKAYKYMAGEGKRLNSKNNLRKTGKKEQ
jgi:hypothetical protein